jgi:hypothetical protein
MTPNATMALISATSTRQRQPTATNNSTTNNQSANEMSLSWRLLILNNSETTGGVQQT